MFNRKDPLIDSVKNIMKENEIRREAERKLNEELGIASKKALPFEHHANYDALLEQKISEALHPNQQKLDVHEPEKDKLTAQDFKMLRAMGKKKEMKEASAMPGDGVMGSGTVTKDNKDVVSPTATRSGSEMKKPETPAKSVTTSPPMPPERPKDLKEEELDEVSRKTLHSYVNKAIDRVKSGEEPEGKRAKGLRKATTKLYKVDEESYSAKAARAGKDIGKPGKMFKKIASDAAKRYGSEERGKKVAGAVLAKLRSKSMEEQTVTQTDPITGEKKSFDHGQVTKDAMNVMKNNSEYDAAIKNNALGNIDRRNQFVKDLESRGEKEHADWIKKNSAFKEPHVNKGTRPEASKAFDDPTPEEERAKSAKDADARRKNELAKAEQDLEQTRKDKAHSAKVKDLSSKIEREKAGEDTRGTFEKIKSSVKSAMGLDEKAPPGAKFERMVKHIKKKYAKDGLTKQEKSIAYATAWKAKNKEEMKEAVETELKKNLGEDQLNEIISDIMGAAKSGLKALSGIKDEPSVAPGDSNPSTGPTSAMSKPAEPKTDINNMKPVGSAAGAAGAGAEAPSTAPEKTTPKPAAAKPDISAAVQKSIDADNPGTPAPPEKPAAAAPKPTPRPAAPRPAAPAPKPAAAAPKSTEPMGGGEDSSSPLAATRQYNAAKAAGAFDNKPAASAPAARPAAPRPAATAPMPPSRPAGVGSTGPSNMAAGRAAERSVPMPQSRMARGGMMAESLEETIKKIIKE